MTDAERSELEMLEGRAMRRALTEFEEERLCALRERQRESRCFRMVLDECVPYDPTLLDRILAMRPTTAAQRYRIAQEYERNRQRHTTMLPPPAEDDGELE